MENLGLYNRGKVTFTGTLGLVSAIGYIDDLTFSGDVVGTDTMHPFINAGLAMDAAFRTLECGGSLGRTLGYCRWT